MKKCPICETSHDERMNFCLNCGHVLTNQNLSQAPPKQTLFLQNSPSQLLSQPLASPSQEIGGTQMPIAVSQPMFQQTSSQCHPLQSSGFQPDLIAKQKPMTKKSDRWLNISAALNLLLAIFLLFQIAFAPLSFSEGNNEDEKYEELNRKHIELENQYNTLNEDYNNLQSDYYQLQLKYESLQNNYTYLQNNYLSIRKDWEFLQNINVGHLMETCYNDIREIYEERWGSIWWWIIGDPEEVITFAANLAEHDLGRIYWVNVNEKYNSLRSDDMPEDMHMAALEKLSYVPDYIGITEYDGPVTKVEKILDFVSSWVHYEHDLNNEFFSPIETLTFRSGDCDDFAILVSALFELVGLEAGIVFVTNDEGDGHAMTLLHLEDLGGYDYYCYPDLTDYGLKEGKWILIEPQTTIDNQANEGWMEQWSGEYFIEIERHVD